MIKERKNNLQKKIDSIKFFIQLEGVTTNFLRTKRLRDEDLIERLNKKE
jgi:hypothetical protein